MTEAVIIATARTPIGKAYRGLAVAGCDPDEMGGRSVFASPSSWRSTD